MARGRELDEVDGVVETAFLYQEPKRLTFVRRMPRELVSGQRLRPLVLADTLLSDEVVPTATEIEGGEIHARKVDCEIPRMTTIHVAI